jgi:hypothetical protein
MLKGLKIIGIIPKKGMHPTAILLLIVAAEILVLAWITWLIFRN